MMKTITDKNFLQKFYLMNTSQIILSVINFITAKIFINIFIL